MSKYIEQLIATEQPRALEAIRIKIMQIGMEAAKNGALRNSRLFLTYQAAIESGLEVYGKTLLFRVREYEPAHAPFKYNELSELVASIDAVFEESQEIYNELIERKKPFGDPTLPFDHAHCELIVQGAKNEINAFQSEFKSKTSFFRRLSYEIAQNIVLRLVTIAFSAVVLMALAWFEIDRIPEFFGLSK
jgi:hypothetical protein